MGRLRKTARFIFSVGGYDGVSPIAKEDEKTVLLKQQNALIEAQTRALRNAARPQPQPGQKRYCRYCRRETTASPDDAVPYVHVANGSFTCPKK